MALLTWITIFPLITAIVAITGPLLKDLPLAVRLGITTALTVPLMTWVVMPRVTRLVVSQSPPLARKGRHTMSDDSLHFAGVVLITVPAIALGGVRLLRMIFRREPGYLDNPVRQNLWRAGHAHAGVLVIFTLVGLLLVDQADLSSGLEWLVRYGLAAGPILMPLGFFLSVASPRAERPNRLIYLVPLGGLSLSVGAVTLGVGLLGA